MENPRSFYLHIDMGDLAYSLLFAKLLGVTDLYIDAKAKTCKFNLKSAEFMLPLLKYQSYIRKAELFENQSYDCNYGLHPKNENVFVGTNLTEYHASKFNLVNDLRLNEPWLSAPILNHKIKRVVINRTARYHSQNPIYSFLLSSVFPFSDCFFVGLPEEHSAFEEEFKIKIPFCPTQDALELAAIINSAEIFLGNESLACAIATGLGKTTFIEYCPIAANYIFTNRVNTFYF